MGKGGLSASLGFVIAVVLGIAGTLPAESKLSSEQVSQIVEESKVLGSDTRVRVEINDSEHEAVITTIRNPKATDRDCKIDSVLIAKKIFDADPQGLARVRVVFYDYNNTNNYKQVVVHEADVKAFALHVINQDTLLAGLDMPSGQVKQTRYPPGRPNKDASQSLEVLPGIYHGERMQLLGQISALQERGVGVTPYMNQFFQIEEKVRSGDDAEVIKLMQSLTEKVNLLSDQYNKAQEQKRRQRTQGQSGAAGPDPSSRAAQARAELGEFAPALGPLFLRRYRVARKVADMNDLGQPIAPYKRLLRELEDLAATKNRAALAARLRWAEHTLGLPSFGEPE